MRVTIDTSSLKATNWRQLLLRFVFGGAVSAASGIIAKLYGPAVGGLFLAFPAIFPASATLIETHERERKQKAGVPGDVQARKAVAIDGAGASIGSLGPAAPRNHSTKVHRGPPTIFGRNLRHRNLDARFLSRLDHPQTLVAQEPAALPKTTLTRVIIRLPLPSLVV